eukprot:gene11506-biopygen13936
MNTENRRPGQARTCPTRSDLTRTTWPGQDRSDPVPAWQHQKAGLHPNFRKSYTSPEAAVQARPSPLGANGRPLGGTAPPPAPAPAPNTERGARARSPRSSGEEWGRGERRRGFGSTRFAGPDGICTALPGICNFVCTSSNMLREQGVGVLAAHLPSVVEAADGAVVYEMSATVLAMEHAVGLICSLGPRGLLPFGFRLHSLAPQMEGTCMAEKSHKVHRDPQCGPLAQS